MSEKGTNVSMGISAGATILSNLTNSLMASKLGKANAASLFRQSMLYGAQGGMQMQSAKAFSSGAKKLIEIGKSNAKQDRLRAAQVQQYEDLQLSEVVKEGQKKVGAGKAAFAANGILLESRSDSAVAMWEGDEVAANVVEQLLTMQEAENTVWEPPAWSAVAPRRSQRPRRLPTSRRRNRFDPPAKYRSQQMQPSPRQPSSAPP